MMFLRVSNVVSNNRHIGNVFFTFNFLSLSFVFRKNEINELDW